MTACKLCPIRLNLEKRLAIAMDGLARAGTTEAVMALQSIAVLAELQEQPLCAPCEVTP